jgi:DNA mismatch repair protein MutS
MHTVTPAMRQYLEAKRQHPTALVFFRMGDFYEMFYEDAVVGSRALDLTLTSRAKDAGGQGVPMCGVPFHAADGYITRLVSKGFRVAVCEQVEDPKKAKGLVRREVVRVVSPGTLTDGAYLDAREPLFLMAVVASRDAGPAPIDTFGVALLDLSTGEFRAAEYAGTSGAQALADELSVLRPREVLVPQGLPVAENLPEIGALGCTVTEVDESAFDIRTAERTLIEQLHVQNLDGFGMRDRPAATRAAGGLLRYLRDSHKADLGHVQSLVFRSAADALRIDAVTCRHLELITGSEGGRDGSLLHEIDRTSSAMGGRLLRSWLLRPLVELERIRERLDGVEELAFRALQRAQVREVLASLQDLERLLGRVVLGTAGPRDFVALARSCAVIPRVREILADAAAPLLRSLCAELDDLADVRQRIEHTLLEDPPALTREGGFTRDGFDAEIDELRTISRSGRQVIADMETAERARTGIASLKVRFNRVFGYYIEISKANLHLAPADYERKQTIAGGERFSTPALRDYEAKILGADEKILARELVIFEELVRAVAAESARIQASARALAALDALTGLAETAVVRNYTKPHVHDGDELVAADVRHPVVEERVSGGFVPNDVELNGSTRHLVILTGPNMGGKSTYLRQTALLPVLAQMGSFVPARDAKVPIVDRIFARVGASDNIARGQSTFMVEMQETANILHTATSRSLVVLDEIGRGTATFDGLSIAWAVAEHLAGHPTARPKTLFATHYHELTDLADAWPGVANAHVAAREWKDDIVFLRKILPGRADRSYGIQVARLAGLPPKVIARAKEILIGLERDELARGGRPTHSPNPDDHTQQLGLFADATAEGSRRTRAELVLARLVALDLDDTSPRAALAALAELQHLANADDADSTSSS